jgi:hypothetical protein
MRLVFQILFGRLSLNGGGRLLILKVSLNLGSTEAEPDRK